jgi:transposase
MVPLIMLWDDRWVGRRFVSPDRDQQFLLPPDMREWLPPEHAVWVVLDAVGQFDLSGFVARYRADGRSRPPYHPGMLVGLLLWAYSQGLRSSRAIERACQENVAFRVITGGLRVDHATLCRFRGEHQDALADLHVQVLALLARAGMVALGRVSLDGTKIAADVSWSANRTSQQIGEEIAQVEADLRGQVEAMLSEAATVDRAEDELFGPDGRAEAVPPSLRSRQHRLTRLKQVKAEMDDAARAAQATQDAKVVEYQRRREAGEPTGRPPLAAARITTRNGAAPRRNTTDPDARVMKSKHTLLIGYNAQAVVTDDQVIVGADLTQAATDATLLPNLLRTTHDQAAQAGLTFLPGRHATPDERADKRADDDATPVSGGGPVVLADAGYANENAFAQAEQLGVVLYAPLHKNIDPRSFDPAAAPADPARRPATARGLQRLTTAQGREHYKHRGRTVEPVFGQIKTIQNLTRFSRRGLPAARSEWLFSVAVHNLRKLINHPPGIQPA